MVRHRLPAAVAVVTAVLVGYATASTGHGEEGGKLLRRERGLQNDPCNDRQPWSKNWARMGMPCNYKKEVVYPGALPLPFPRKDVHAILNRTKAMLKGHTYDDELTTTAGPTTSGEARPQGAGIAEPLEAKPTPAIDVPLGLKEAVEWRQMTRSVPVSPLVPGQEKKKEGAYDRKADRVPLPGGPVYRPHFVGAEDQKPYFLDEDPKMMQRPSYQTLKDSRDLHDNNATSQDVPPRNPSASQDRNPDNKGPIGSTKTDEDNKTKADALLRVATAMNQEVKGDISREANY